MPKTTARPAADDRSARKSIELTLKSLDDDGSFVMYAAAFDNVDRGGDLIEKGAFANLDEFVRDGWIALNHRASDLAVGYPTAATQDERGLRIEGKFHTTEQAQALRTVVRERLAAGKGVKASIGYQTVKARQAVVDGQPVRRLEQVRIYEASFVNLPMNPAADVVSAKAAEGESPMSDKNQTEPESKGLIAALKELLGLSKKAAESGKMSKAGMTRLKAFAEEIHEHGEATREHAKAMHEHGKAAQACAKEMKTFIKAYDPDEEDDGADDDEEQDEEPRPKKGKKAEAPEDTSDADPPKKEKEKSADRHSIAVKLALLRPPAE